MTTNFQNQFCSFSFNINEKEISGSCLRDTNNYPACYNKTTRSFKKALQLVNEKFNNECTMYDVIDIISETGVKMRSYCSMD